MTVSTHNVQTIRKILTWTAPALAIPALRYTQDNQEQRKELFVRDASTYSIGAIIFLATEFIAEKTLNAFKLFKTKETRNLSAFLVALTANLLYAGIGAVRFSKAFSKYQASREAAKNETSQNAQKNMRSLPNIATPWPAYTVQPLFRTFTPPFSQRVQYFA